MNFTYISHTCIQWHFLEIRSTWERIPQILISIRREVAKTKIPRTITSLPQSSGSWKESGNSYLDKGCFSSHLLDDHFNTLLLSIPKLSYIYIYHHDVDHISRILSPKIHPLYNFEMGTCATIFTPQKITKKRPSGWIRLPKTATPPACYLMQLWQGTGPRKTAPTFPAWWLKKTLHSIPIGSMYGIFTYIWLIFMVNVGKYTIHGSYGICMF